MIAGIDNTDTRVLSIVKNQGNNQFQKIESPVQGISNGSIQAADFNNDGLTDLLVFGINPLNQRVGNIYRNNGDFTFTKQNNGFPSLAYASAATGDLTGDGLIDFVCMGMQQSGVLVSSVFKNNGDGSFTDVNAALPGLYQGSVHVGDHDNDGDLDLLLCGYGTSGRHTLLYTNLGNGNFTEAPVPFEDVAQGMVRFTDFDRDADLDAVLTGYTATEPKTIVYRNLLPITPTNPLPPGTTGYESLDDTVILKWSKGNDDQTPDNGLTYSLAIGTSPGYSDIYSPGAELTTGIGFYPEQGACGTDTFALVTDLPEGKYYWQVQAIDNTFLGSVFSETDSFVVCDPVRLGNDTSVCLHQNLHLNVGEGNDVVNWYSSTNGLLIAAGFDLNYAVEQNDTIWVEVFNDLGCHTIDSMVVSPLALPDIDLPADTTVCKNSVLTLSAGAFPDSVNWYSNEGLLESNTFTFDFLVTRPDTIWATGYNPFGCFNTDTLRTDTLTLPYFFLGPDTAICSALLYETSVIGFDSVNWYNLNGLIAADTETLNFEVNTDETFICEVFNALSCSYSDTLLVSARALPTANSGNDSTICYQSPLVLGGYPAATGGMPPYTYAWLPPEMFPDPSLEHPRVILSENKQLILNVTDAYQCTDYDTVYITVNPESITDIPDAFTFCLHESVTLGGTPTATGSLFPYVYNWSPAESLSGPFSSNPMATPDDTTVYRLILSTWLCVPDTFYTTVFVRALPEVSAGDDLRMGSGESVELIANGAENYEWLPDLYLNDRYSANPIATPSETVTYTLTGTDAFGCTASDSITLTVINEIFIPNLFTPNQDGNNDTFKVYGTGINELQLRIYDRDGRLIFESKDKEEIMQTGWDGTFNGTPMPQGTYIWMVTGIDNTGMPINYKGNRGTVFLLK